MKALQINHKTIYFLISLIIILAAFGKINPVYGNDETTTINKISIGANGEKVKELQKLLNEYGYEIAIDGNFGKETESAVMAFQKIMQLPENGIVDNETWRQLYFITKFKKGIIWMIAILFVCFVCNKAGFFSWVKSKLHFKKVSYIKASDFLKHWSSYRGHDKPGCYVFLIFDKPVKNNNYSKYQNVYVGQSIHVYKRVKSHLSGKGNGDVYADYRYGKHVYVTIYPCARTELNHLEKQLITLYKATKSYNKTAGGGTHRY